MSKYLVQSCPQKIAILKNVLMETHTHEAE